MITVSSMNLSPQYLKSNQRPWIKYATCDATDRCPLYSEGKCACYRYILGENLTCPNAEWHYKTGPTKRARSFSDFVVDARKRYEATAEQYNAKLCRVAGYVCIPMTGLSLKEHCSGGAMGNFIEESSFNEDKVEEIIKYRPQTWLYEPYKGYQEKELPLFVQQLKEVFPEIYDKWTEKYPETAAKYEGVSPVGRIAYVNTLKEGAEIKTSNGTFEKDGGFLICKSWKSAFIPSFGTKDSPEAYVRIYITPDMTTEVTNEEQVSPDTQYLK